MKFLVDAQLPRRLSYFIAAKGHDSIHTLELGAGNRTPDAAVAGHADTEGRIVVTKDADFVASHFNRGVPAHLLVIATGNTSNADLEALFERHWGELIDALSRHRYVELHRSRLVVGA